MKLTEFAPLRLTAIGFLHLMNVPESRARFFPVVRSRPRSQEITPRGVMSRTKDPGASSRPSGCVLRVRVRAPGNMRMLMAALAEPYVRFVCCRVSTVAFQRER